MACPAAVNSCIQDEGMRLQNVRLYFIIAWLEMSLPWLEIALPGSGGRLEKLDGAFEGKVGIPPLS
jgi:hypothetical protein